MTVNLSIKNVPEPLAEKLRRRAMANHRSLQGELMALIEDALISASEETNARVPVRENAERNRSIAEIGRELRTIFPKVQSVPPGTSAVEMVRKMRDGRDGSQWLDPLHHEKGY